MSDTMIERVARKLMAVAIGAGADSRGLEWAEFEHDARDLLAAMREPTEVMLTEETLFGGFVQAGDDELEDNFYHDPEDAKQIWRAMIEAALAECPN